MNMIDRSPAEKIRRTLHELCLDPKELAQMLDLGEEGARTVRRWANGEHSPSSAILEKIFELPGRVPFASNHSENPKFTFTDLFAGIGGIRLPFQQLGGKCVFTSEWDRFAQKTYAANFGERPHGDITKVPASEIPEHDLLLAGFPCQAFSQAGLKKGFLDTRGTMFFEIQRILAHHRPKAFLLENVKQLRGHDKGRTLQTILDILRGNHSEAIPSDVPLSDEARNSLSQRLDYSVGFRVLNATHFGVPQKRERIYIIGFDRQLCTEDEIEQMFERLSARPKTVTLGNVLESNASIDPKYTISDQLLAGHERRKREHKAKGNGFGFSVFDHNSPYCNTISARYYKDGSEVMIDQSDIGKNPRKLTPRECARIQGFPEKFNVSAVSDTQIYKQFGNSVSVPVIRAIAEEMAKPLQAARTGKVKAAMRA